MKLKVKPRATREMMSAVTAISANATAALTTDFAPPCLCLPLDGGSKSFSVLEISMVAEGFSSM